MGGSRRKSAGGNKDRSLLPLAPHSSGAARLDLHSVLWFVRDRYKTIYE